MILEFDSLEEFFEYSARMQPLPAQVTASQSLVSTSANEAVQSSATQLQPPKALKPKKSTLRKPLPSYKTSTFKPPVGMLKKVQQFIAENRAFKTADVVDEWFIKDPQRRARANKWLQEHPALTFVHLKGVTTGRGPLVYTPAVQNGTVTLPPGKPGKTDWPIKGASIKKSYVPSLSEDEDDDLLQALETPAQMNRA